MQTLSHFILFVPSNLLSCNQTSTVKCPSFSFFFLAFCQRCIFKCRVLSHMKYLVQGVAPLKKPLPAFGALRRSAAMPLV